MIYIYIFQSSQILSRGHTLYSHHLTIYVSEFLQTKSVLNNYMDYFHPLDQNTCQADIDFIPAGDQKACKPRDASYWW